MPFLLVTGADGFVGRALLAEAGARGVRVRGVTRRPCRLDSGAENVAVGAMDGDTDWRAALDEGVEAVIHLAARVHVMRDTHADPLAEFLKVNLEGTANLARQAARAGVRRFVFVSSIKVNGEQTADEQVFTASGEPHPQDSYAVSKWRAEQALREIGGETGMEIVIVRPPLIYGPGVKGNLLQLLQAVEKGIPLPFARVHNVRSMLYVGNLVDILLLCATHPAAAGRTYLLRDGEDVAVPELIALLAQGLQKKPRLFAFPLWLLRLSMTAAGLRGAYERLTGSLRIDDAPIRRELGWTPRFSPRQGLPATAAHYREARQPL